MPNPSTATPKAASMPMIAARSAAIPATISPKSKQTGTAARPVDKAGEPNGS